MIHSKTKVQWADVNRSDVQSGPISLLFQSFTFKASRSGFTEIIQFTDDDNVKITDWTGWTNILCIKKIATSISIPEQPRDHHTIYVQDTLWHKLISGNKEIIISKNATIPIYKPTEAISGFHGEIKYPYVIKYPFDIKSGELIRILDIDDNTPAGFGEVNINPCSGCQFGYEIYTKSKFFNANDFHLFGSEGSIKLDGSSNYK